MSIASFEGKNVYRMDYTTVERLDNGDDYTKEAIAFYIATTPQDAIDALEEALAPLTPTVMNLTLAMEGEDLKYRVPVLN